MIDTHAHLYLEHFSDDLDEVLQRARDQGVRKVLLPNIDGSTALAMKDLCHRYPDMCYPMMGLHPCSVKEETYLDELELVRTELESGQFIAVGEIGIDLYWDKSTLEIQKLAFKQQIEWAEQLGLPIAIHTRDAFDAVFEVLDTADHSKLSGVFHCFNGNLGQLEHIVDSYPNFMFGLGGVVTFKNGGMDTVVPEIPLDKILLETDSPYLTPAPHRGKRNESAYTKIVGQRVADLYQVSLDRITEVTTANTGKLFGVS